MASSSHQDILAKRPRCEQYGLQRREVFYDLCRAPFFMEPFVGKAKWQDWEINPVVVEPGDNLYGERTINTYATSVTRGAYITYGIDTTRDAKHGAPRITDMKHRDLIIDNWLSAGGSLHDLTFIGTSTIINPFGMLATKHAFLVEGLNYADGGQVELYPDDELYNGCTMTNPFIAGLDRLAKSLGRTIKRFVFITIPDYGGGDLDLVIDEPVCHLVMEMAKPEDPTVSRPARSLNLSPEWREMLAHVSLLDWIKIREEQLETRYVQIAKALRAGGRGYSGGMGPRTKIRRNAAY